MARPRWSGRLDDEAEEDWKIPAAEATEVEGGDWGAGGPWTCDLCIYRVVL